jgi:hypothetical protein
MTIPGFISWAHKDHKLLEQLWPHVKTLERANNIEFWIDRDKLLGGDTWNARIEAAIKAAECILIMVSENCLASEYIYDNELPLIAARRKAGRLVVPVYLKPCIFGFAINPLQAVPTSPAGRLTAIMDWKPPRNGPHEAISQAANAIAARFGTPPTAPFDWGP